MDTILVPYLTSYRTKPAIHQKYLFHTGEKNIETNEN